MTKRARAIDMLETGYSLNGYALCAAQDKKVCTKLKIELTAFLH